METLGEIIAFVCFCLLLNGVQTVCHEVLDLLETRVARNWPVVEAVITACRVRESRQEGSNDIWVPLLRYGYEVNGALYSGSMRLAPWRTDYKSACSSSHALLNQKIHIRYKPELPVKSRYLVSDGGPVHLDRRDNLIRRLLWLCFLRV